MFSEAETGEIAGRSRDCSKEVVISNCLDETICIAYVTVSGSFELEGSNLDQLVLTSPVNRFICRKCMPQLTLYLHILI